MSRDDSSHLPLRSAHDRRLREDSGPTGANVMAYDAGGGDVRNVPGDRKFPFVMVPPDLGTPGLYSDDVVPIVAPVNQVGLNAMLQGLPIDVRGLRRLTFYVSLLLPAGPRLAEPLNNALAVVPQVANAISRDSQQRASVSYTVPAPSPEPALDDLVWHTIAVVDPVIRGAFPTALDTLEAFNAPTYGFRNVHMTQLNLPYPANTGAFGVTEIHTTLVFDVAPYEYFRLLLGRVYEQLPATVIIPSSGNTLDVPPGGQFRFFVQGQR